MIDDFNPRLFKELPPVPEPSILALMLEEAEEDVEDDLSDIIVNSMAILASDNESDWETPDVHYYSPPAADENGSNELTLEGMSPASPDPVSQAGINFLIPPSLASSEIQDSHDTVILAEASLEGTGAIAGPSGAIGGFPQENEEEDDERWNWFTTGDMHEMQRIEFAEFIEILRWEQEKRDREEKERRIREGLSFESDSD